MPELLLNYHQLEQTGKLFHVSDTTHKHIAHFPSATQEAEFKTLEIQNRQVTLSELSKNKFDSNLKSLKKTAHFTQHYKNSTNILITTHPSALFLFI